MGTLGQTVKLSTIWTNIGIFNMLQANLPLRSAYESCSCLLLCCLYYNIPSRIWPAAARREHASYLDLPTNPRMRRRQENCQMPGRRYLIIQGRKKVFIFIY